MKMKKIAVLFVSGCLMVSQPIMAGGIPVFDGAAVEQAIQQGIQMKQQIDNQISQLRELESQVKAMSGWRDVGKVAKSALDTATGIGSEWGELYSQAKVTANIQNDLDGKKYSHEKNLMQMLQTQKLNIKSLKEAQSRMDKIIDLGRQAQNTQDIKAAQDFANRIAIEQGYIQAMQMKLDMAERVAKQQEKIQQQQYAQRQECMAKQIRNRNYKACL
ncbi:type IV secretion system protein [Kingella kingae]|uniref:type IV secretion system protein n=1 Tax=Kingella kingae TaxID=504 RepID=UPI00031496E1|nr:type IV secretion system protein [Kingella kingae]MDK4555860.1 type IV secretion system protein [Kingella kingae]MDK4576864.1 type IV secretion system protein [Kingella kingae]MDK4582932.1 type IV secretion system protein [Kingella kingae]MDK4584968.1 type IV secretion system protein [Kingella kingae]MDK4588956.1 type IV secretion system protein [Kingella kingae]